MPAITAISTAVKSCQVFHVRRSLILSSPGWSWASDDASEPVSSGGDVTDLAPNMQHPRQVRSQKNHSCRDSVRSGIYQSRAVRLRLDEIVSKCNEKGPIVYERAVGSVGRTQPATEVLKGSRSGESPDEDTLT
jgi:hypothetical protein